MFKIWKVSGFACIVASVVLIVAACAPAAVPPTAVPAAAPAAPAPTQAPAAPVATQAGAAGQANQAPAAATAIALQTQLAGAAQPTATTGPAAAAASGSSNQKITLKFLGAASPSDQNAYNQELVNYQKTHPNIDVQWEQVAFNDLFPKIQAIAAAKTDYDILWADGPNIWGFAYNGVIQPMDQWFDRAYITENWLPSSLVTAYYKGKFYAPPERESCSLLWYNKDMTDAAGIQPPREFSKSWTMEQALVAWQKLNNPPTVYGLRWGQGAGPGQDYENGIFRRSAGASRTSNAFLGLAPDGLTISGYFDDPAAIKGHQFLQDLHQKYKVSPTEAVQNAWLTKKAAMYLSPDNAIAQYNQLQPGFAYAVTGIPYFTGGTQLCHNDSLHYALGAFSKHPAEAADFIKYMSGAEGGKIYFANSGQIPANVKVLNSVPEYQKYPESLVLEQFKAVATPRIVTVGFTEYNTLATEFFQNLIQTPNANVAQLAHDMAKRTDQLTAKYKDWQTK